MVNRTEDFCYAGHQTLSGLNDETFTNRQVDFEQIFIKNNRFFYGKPAHPFNKENDVFPDHVDLEAIHNAQSITENFYVDGEIEWDGAIDVFQTLYFSQHTPKHIKANNSEEFFLGKAGSELDGASAGDGEEESGSSTSDNGFGVNDSIDQNEREIDLIVPHVHYHISDFVVDANEYYVDSPLRTLMGFGFDNFCNTEGIKITNNIIKYGPWTHPLCQLQDFRIIYDKNPDFNGIAEGLEGSNKKCLDPIIIEGNTIECKALPYIEYYKSSNSNNPNGADSEQAEMPAVPYRTEEHFLLNIENASVTLTNNIIDCYLDPDNVASLLNIDDLGFMLLYSREKGGRVTMNNNVFRGMICMGSFDMPQSNAFSRIELNASNNIFQGTTQFNSTNMQEGIFNFSNNTFFANSDQLLLNEMPKKTLLTLRENVFRRNVGTVGEGFVYYHYTPNPGSTQAEHPLPSDMTIISSGNVFDNINGHKCPYYSGGENFKDFKIFSSNEDSLSDDYYEAKNE